MCSLQFVWRHAYGLGCVVLATMLVGGGARAGSVPRYTLTDLGTLPGASDSGATGLNDHGDVVGGSDSAAFLYSGGKMIALTELLGHAPLANEATGINDSGQVIGIFSGLGITAAWMYNGGKLTSFSGPTTLTDASAINAEGQVVGWSNFGIADIQEHAALFAGGAAHDLGTLGGSSALSSALAINDKGNIVGSSGLGLHSQYGHAFLYSGGVLRDLGTLGGNDSVASRINNLGQIVGLSSVTPADNSVRHLFLYSDGTMHDLGSPGQVDSTGPQVTGFNDNGQILVDFPTYSSSRTSHAFLYTNGTEYDLSTLVVGAPGYVLEDANGINESGQIAGTALTPSGATHAVLLTPTATTSIPVPPAAWAVLTALPLLLIGRRLIAGEAARAAG